jgi:CRISPR-associated protein Cmr1
MNATELDRLLEGIALPKTLSASYKIVTPMILGGADADAPQSINPQSFKGAMRFWWRALNWSKCLSLSKLHEEECRLFGADSTQGGQGVCTLRLTHGTYSANNTVGSLNGFDYLTIGTNGKMNSKNRRYIPAGVSISIALSLKPNATQSDIDSLKDALLALGFFGGIGAKSRKGFGSLAIEELDGQSYRVKTVSELKSIGEALLSNYPLKLVANRPEYSALSAESQWFDMAETHRDLASVYKDFLTSHQQSGNGKLEFGEPKVAHSKNPNKDRRGSPLFMHVHPIGENQQCAAILFMPAVWSSDKPKGDKNYALVKEFLSNKKLDTLWEGK